MYGCFVWSEHFVDLIGDPALAGIAANRLMKADFTQYTGGTFNQDAGINFNVKMGDGLDPTLAYDANGNILKMQQWGLKLNGSSQIDNLSYLYQTNSNRLARVSDGILVDNKLGDFKDGTNTGTDDYSYDVNGNLNLDNNKAISSITYNHLNLPSVVTVTGKGTITYTYDAAGNKQKKTTQENNATVAFNGTNYTNVTITTTTTYIGGFIYESKTYSDGALSSLQYTDKLQFAGQEEGRIRALYDNAASPNTITGFAYDYFVKDHLGNVRMVLTDEQKTIYYPAATLEGTYSATGTAQANSMVNYEKQFYTIDYTKVTDEGSIPSWPTETVANTKLYYNYNGNPPSNLSYPAGCTPVQTDGSTKLYKLNATTNKTGLEFIIKVMAGDKIDIFGKSYYLNTTTVSNGNSTTLDLLGLMTDLLGAPGNAAAQKGYTATQLNTINSSLVPSSFFRGNNNETGTTVPKAYINYIFFDEQFKFAGGNFSRVGSSGSVKDHWYLDAAQLQNITVPKNGYIFVYVSNESNFDVFFDNLQVIHKPGPLIEETHYYPFGLTMAGISSNRLPNNVPNRKKFNGIEETRDLDLNQYDAFYRTMDPQVGRWWQIDPQVDLLESYSPYEGMGNNPISNEDPLGDFKTRFGAWLNKVFHGGGKIDKNEYGEYYVSKGSFYVSQDNRLIATSHRYYGKGRDKYSAAREKLLEEFDNERIERDLTREGIWDPNLSPAEARNNTLSYVNLFLPNAILKPVTNATNTSTVSHVTEAGKDIAKTPVGRSGNLIKVITKNIATIIGGRKFTGHALDQMQASGILSPSAVIDVIQNPAKTIPGNLPGTMVYIRDNLKVVTNTLGDVITVMFQ